MSLDDYCATEYFGPDAQRWDSPDGRTLSLSPGQVKHYRPKLIENGWSHNDDIEIRNANGDVCVRIISLDNAATDPVYDDLFHRPGCSVQRNDRCICAYLNQWDATGYLAPTFRKDQQ